ncbi:hypothetical protein KEM48_001568 [Puccinia striiformis f. sp. tritici PST-130]|nr:hypothetical protein KEM48_001568 [Puccinia striiformis f. sp. tritici PST-130]
MNTFFGLAIVFLATWCSQLITAFDPQTEFECPKKQPHGLCGHQLSPDTNGNWTMTVLDPPDDNFPLQFNWCEDPRQRSVVTTSCVTSYYLRSRVRRYPTMPNSINTAPNRSQVHGGLF